MNIFFITYFVYYFYLQCTSKLLEHTLDTHGCFPYCFSQRGKTTIIEAINPERLNDLCKY